MALPFLQYQWLILKVLASAEPIQFENEGTFEAIYNQLIQCPFATFSPSIADILVNIFDSACNQHLPQTIFQYWGLDSLKWEEAYALYTNQVEESITAAVELATGNDSSKYSDQELYIWRRLEGALGFIKTILLPRWALAVPPNLGGIPYLSPASITSMLNVLITMEPLCTLVRSSSSLVLTLILTNSAALYFHCTWHHCF